MKRLIAIVLSMALVCAFVPAAGAANDEMKNAAQSLYDLGLFQGVGNNTDGTPDFALDRVPTRAEAVTMLVRLLGKDAEAKAGTWETPFTDVAEWAKPYVGYAYANGLTTGTSATTFGGDVTVNATQYLTFVLRALGYTSGTDFKWDSAWTKSDEIKLTTGEYNADTTSFTRGDVAHISERALSAKSKGGKDTLLTTLVSAKAVTEKAADNYLHPPVAVEAVKLSKNTLELELGKSEKITATVTPDNATDKTVTWKSSNTAVATVDNGTIKAVSEGSAVISAITLNDRTAECKVSVVKRALNTAPLYEDSNVKIMFSHIEKSKYDDNEIKLYLDVQNKTASQITVQNDAVNLNGYCFNNTIMSDRVSANTIGSVDATIKVVGQAPITPETVETIGGQFRIIPSGGKTYNALFQAQNIYTGAKDKAIPEANEGQRLYSDGKLEFYFGFAEPDRYSKDGSEIEVYLFVRNKTNKTYLIQNDTVVIDGRSYNRTIMSDPILPYSAGYVNVSIREYNGPRPETITAIGGDFRIIDDNGSEKTYTAKMGSSGNSSTSSGSNSSSSGAVTTGKDINDLLEYISNYGISNKTEYGTFKKIQRKDTTSSATNTAVITYRDDINKLIFHYTFDTGKQSMYVSFDYDIATESISSRVGVYGLPGGIGLSTHADIDISTYTSSTTLSFEKDSEEGLFGGAYPDDYNELSNSLLLSSIYSFGLLIGNEANMTLADIGFTAFK